MLGLTWDDITTDIVAVAPSSRQAICTAAARWYAHAIGATELWNLGGVIGLAVADAPFFLGEPENNGWDTPASATSCRA